MTRFVATNFVIVALSFFVTASMAFIESPRVTRPSTSLSASSMGRREAFIGIAAVFSAGALSEPASAKYSDYARREKDWEQRLEKGEVKISSARDLRAQLQEIAPMNTSNSKIFCPNGPSANVSPLMENKCGDRLATPSVFGRQNDVMGNSIPGFREGYFAEGGSSSMSAKVGGFPSYK